MRIAYVIDYLFSVNGGTERQLHRLIQGMVKRGHEVELYVFRHTDFTRSLSNFDCAVFNLEIGSLAAPGSWLKLLGFRFRLLREKVDVVHGFFNDVALTIPPLFIGTGIRTITSRRDMGIWYSPGKLRLLRATAKLNASVICNCDAVAQLTKQAEGVRSDRIHVVHNGMDPMCSDIDHAGAGPEELTANYSVNSSTIKVVLVANVRPIKSIEDVIKACAQVFDAGMPVEFYIIGHLSDVSYHEALLNLARKLGIAHSVRFLGPISEPRAYLREFDIGVLSSQSEGLSNTLMEYLDAGLPVVVTNVGGNPDLVDDGFNGFLYESGDVVALADRLKKLGSDPLLRESLGISAKTSAGRFSVATMLTKHEAIYGR